MSAEDEGKASAAFMVFKDRIEMNNTKVQLIVDTILHWTGAEVLVMLWTDSEKV